MDLNLKISEIFDEELTQKIAEQIGEETKRVRKALQHCTPIVVAGLYKRTLTDIGLKHLHQVLSKHAEKDIEKLKNALATVEQTQTYVKESDVILSQVLPSFKSSLIQLVGALVGTRNSSSSAMIGLSLRAVLEKLANQVKTEDWDKVDLANYLLNEYEAIKTDISVEIFDKINGALSLRLGANAHRTPPTPVKPIERKEKSSKVEPIRHQAEQEPAFVPTAMPWKKMGLILGLGILGTAAYWGWGQYKNHSTQSSEEIDSLTLEQPISEISKDSVTGAVAQPIPTATAPTEVMSSFGTKLATYLADSTARFGKTFKLENVEFIQGTPELDLASSMVLDELSALMKKYPKSQIKVISYANDGNAAIGNKTLSVKRALAIKQKLIGAGIDFIRINTIGLGDGVVRDSLNPDPTALGIRRIDLKIVQK